MPNVEMHQDFEDCNLIVRYNCSSLFCFPAAKLVEQILAFLHIQDSYCKKKECERKILLRVATFATNLQSLMCLPPLHLQTRRTIAFWLGVG